LEAVEKEKRNAPLEHPQSCDAKFKHFASLIPRSQGQSTWGDL